MSEVAEGHSSFNKGKALERVVESLSSSYWLMRPAFCIGQAQHDHSYGCHNCCMYTIDV